MPLVKAFGGDVPDGVSREEVAATGAELLARASARAGRLGVTCVVETHDGFCRGRDLAALLALAPPAATGALWDVHHPVRMGEAVEKTDDAIGERVAHVHVKDAVASGAGWRFTALGEGALPIPELLTKPPAAASTAPSRSTTRSSGTRRWTSRKTRCHSTRASCGARSQRPKRARSLLERAGHHPLDEVALRKR